MCQCDYILVDSLYFYTCTPNILYCIHPLLRFSRFYEQSLHVAPCEFQPTSAFRYDTSLCLYFSVAERPQQNARTNHIGRLGVPSPGLAVAGQVKWRNRRARSFRADLLSFGMSDYRAEYMHTYMGALLLLKYLYLFSVVLLSR